MEYTYTILHKPSGKKYHGSKYAKDADPEQLFNMSHNSPYFTSSSVVHELIEEDGVESFEIIEITIFLEKGKALKEEQRFLKMVFEKEPENWLNKKHGCLSHDDPVFIQRMIDKYGVDHNMKIPDVVERIKATNLERYGHTCPLQSQKAKDAVFEKYGVDNVFQHEEIKQKIRETNLERYGVENPSQSPEIILKKKATWEQNFGEGVDIPWKSPDIAAKRNASWLERYGVPWPQKPEILRARMRVPKSEQGRKNIGDAIRARPSCSCLCCGMVVKVVLLNRHIKAKHKELINESNSV